VEAGTSKEVKIEMSLLSCQDLLILTSGTECFRVL
jgi:hypothetical protein